MRLHTLKSQMLNCLSATDYNIGSVRLVTGGMTHSECLATPHCQPLQNIWRRPRPKKRGWRRRRRPPPPRLRLRLQMRLRVRVRLTLPLRLTYNYAKINNNYNPDYHQTKNTYNHKTTSRRDVKTSTIVQRHFVCILFLLRYSNNSFIFSLNITKFGVMLIVTGRCYPGLNTL